MIELTTYSLAQFTLLGVRVCVREILTFSSQVTLSPASRGRLFLYMFRTE